MFKNLPTISKFCEIILRYSIYALVFILPILFLPWTSDVLDFNKQAILILFVFVALFAWIAKVLISGRFVISINKTHIAILVLFFVYILSTIFSLDKYGSFWGWPRITSESLLTLMGLVLFYLLLSNVLTKKEIFTSIVIFVLSGLLAIFIGVLHLFGFYVFSGNPSFNTIGLVGAFGLFIAVLLPLMIILEIYAKKWLKIIFAIGIILSAAAFIAINYLMVWWMVLIGCGLLMLFLMLKRDIFDLRWLGLPMFFLALALFFLVLNPQIPLPSRPVEVYLNQSATFDVAIKALKDAPIFGSGPGTFIYDFSKYKKVDFNQGLLWNIRFEGGSKILTHLATTGIFGFISLLVLMATVLIYGIKFIFSKDVAQETNSSYFWALGGGVFVAFIVQTVGYFFYNSTLSLDFLYFFLIACFIGLVEENKKEYLLKPSSFLTLAVTFVFTLVFMFGLGILILNGQRYIAEINYFKGVSAFNSNQKDSGIMSLERAVRLNSSSDLYLTELSQMYLSKMGEVVFQENLSEEDRSNIVQILVNNSINAAKIATDVSPKNVSNWSIRGFVYQNLIGMVPVSEDWALKSYDEAIALEPANPYYPTQKGIVYMAMANIINKDNPEQKNQNLEEAKKQFDKAVELKSDYAPARFQIAMVYQAQGKTNQEIAALEEAKQHSPNDVGLLFQIGLIYYQKENFEKARLNLETAANISPNYANALYFLGLTYSKLGQVNKAIEKFQRVSDLNPENEEVRKIIENLKSGKRPLDGIAQEDTPQIPVEETPPESPKK